MDLEVQKELSKWTLSELLVSANELETDCGCETKCDCDQGDAVYKEGVFQFFVRPIDALRYLNQMNVNETLFRFESYIPHEKFNGNKIIVKKKETIDKVENLNNVIVVLEELKRNVEFQNKINRRLR